MPNPWTGKWKPAAEEPTTGQSPVQGLIQYDSVTGKEIFPEAEATVKTIADHGLQIGDTVEKQEDGIVSTMTSANHDFLTLNLTQDVPFDEFVEVLCLFLVCSVGEINRNK